jgi:hypothetical protein
MRAASFLAAFLLLGATACGDEPTAVGSEESGRIQVTGAFFFDAAAPGSVQESSVRVENVGGGDLRIQSVEANPLDVGVIEVSEPDLPFVLRPGESRDLVATFVSEACGASRGSVRIDSNDPERRSVSARVNVEDAAVALALDPAEVDFGRVPAGSCKTSSLTVTNRSVCATSVTDAGFTGDAGFSVVDAVGVAGTIIPPGGAVDLDLRYCAESDAPQAGTLWLAQDVRGASVPLRANTETPCLSVSHEAGVDFGARWIEGTHRREILARNCSTTEPLELSDIALARHPSRGGRDRFALEAGRNVDLAGPITLLPGEKLAWTVLYTPGAAEEHGALLTLRSSDEAKQRLEIEVTGRGSLDACPEPVIGVLGRSAVPGEPLVVEPQATVYLDGTASSDREGAIAAYRWEALAWPAELRPPHLSEPNAEKTAVFMALPGTYRVGLTVVDEAGVESCDRAEIEIQVVPITDILVAAVWRTPNDPTPFDGNGADLDLHFLHPNGAWRSRDWDAHWQARSPNWGSTSRVDDDPYLDTDSTGGDGPEILSFDNPEGTEERPFRYEVGVFSFSDHGFGPSSVLVLIWVRGELALRVGLANLENRQFWHAATIEWPSGTVERVSRLHPAGFP